MARLTWQRRSPTACPGVMDPPGPFAQLLDRRDQEIELWRRRSVEWDAERAQMEASWLHWEAEREEHDNTALAARLSVRQIRQMRGEMHSLRLTIAGLRGSVEALTAMEAAATAEAADASIAAGFARAVALRNDQVIADLQRELAAMEE